MGVVEVLDGAGVVGLEVVGRGVGETGVVVAGAGVCVRVEVGTGRGVGVGRIGRAVSLPPVSYTHLDVYKRQAQPHHGTRPRFMAQPALLPREPLRLERTDGNYSPVETAIRRAIG